MLYRSKARVLQTCGLLTRGTGSPKVRSAYRRNKIAFHYDEAQVKKALVRLADMNSPVRAKVTLGMDYFLDRFNLADTVTETIFVREIMSIPPGGDVEQEFNRSRKFVNELCAGYLRFVREFAINYIREYASV
jgi:hypothetical protein